ncbi:response regulator [Virgibacillus ainsalahensis]
MGKEILVVDDQPGIRLLLTDLLSNEGYHITTASTGKEAVDYANSNTFDLLIIDYKLPVLDGSEVLQKLEENKMKLPVIVISGLVETIDQELQQYNNVKAVIGKPFDISGFIEEVKVIFG